jgi:hypothetical protein
MTLKHVSLSWSTPARRPAPDFCKKSRSAASETCFGRTSAKLKHVSLRPPRLLRSIAALGVAQIGVWSEIARVKIACRDVLIALPAP